VSAAGRFLALLAFVAVLVLPVACDRGSVDSEVNWLYDYDEALTRAQSENKPVMIDFWADWCYWCNELDSKTYSDDQVGQFLNENFVCLKDDVSKSNLGQIYRIGYSIPVILFLNPDGSVIPGGLLRGYRNAEVFLQEAKAVYEQWRSSQAAD